MKKALAVFILLAVLSIGSASLSKPAPEPAGYEGNQFAANYGNNQTGAGAGDVATAQKRESKITIVFAGLIYLRHRGGPKKKGPFTACILKQIPGHTFRLFGDIELRDCDMKKEWDLQVIKGNTPREGAEPVVHEGFHRKKKEHPDNDYQWIADFDELYPWGYDVEDDGSSPVVKIPVGKFYTLCRTVRLGHTKGDVKKDEYGFMADIAGADILLEPGERLVLRSGSCDLIKPLEYEEGTRYIVFANLPPPERMPDHSAHRRGGERQSGPPTHFLNYYFVIQKKYEDRYDFDLMEQAEKCSLPLPLAKLLEDKISRSPPPYYCGVGGGGD